MDKNQRLFMPEAASTVAGQVDSLYYFIHWVSVFFFVLVVVLMTWFVIRYRRRSEQETTPDYTHNTPLEILWSVIPLLILIIIFFWGFGVYMNLRVAPGNAINIYVTAQRWAWSFQYPNGTVSNELVVPVNEPVRLTMSSRDLIHSFFIPQFRVKQDVLPNRYTNAWFEAKTLGDYDLYCTEYCGTGHSQMLAKVKVVTPEEYQKWVLTGGIDPAKMSLPEYGAALYRQRQCVTCHSVDGSAKTGPTFKGVFGHPVKLANGQTVQADENYIRQSILVPSAQVVAGFGNVMPSYQGQLKERELNALVEYIKTLK